MTVFEITNRFPVDERYSMTDQVRRSSRSVCANIVEAWRKRRYPAAFIAKLNDYEHILGKLVTMISHPEQWTLHTIREESIDYA